jgi:hypothetical protein
VDLSEVARNSDMEIVRSGISPPFDGRQDFFVKLR